MRGSKPREKPRGRRGQAPNGKQSEWDAEIGRDAHRVMRDRIVVCVSEDGESECVVGDT